MFRWLSPDAAPSTLQWRMVSMVDARCEPSPTDEVLCGWEACDVSDLVGDDHSRVVVDAWQCHEQFDILLVDSDGCDLEVDLLDLRVQGI